MIEKLDRHIKTEENGVRISCPPTHADCIDKINELVDVVNAIQKERETERFEIQEWIGILEAVRKSVNIHEKQIDELQMKAEPEKTHAPDMYNNDPFGPHPKGQYSDPYAEQREWIGKLCRFWDDNYKITKHFGILTRIDETAIVRYEAENGFWYCACEPVKPDDDIVYKGGDNE